MTWALIALSFSGLLGCYQMATRMSARTPHGMRMAIVVIGVGCVLTMAGETRLALLLMLAGLGLFQTFDRRGGDRERYPR